MKLPLIPATARAYDTATIEAIEKYGEGSRLRVVDDFVAEIASQPVRKTLFCLFLSCLCLVYPEPVLVNGSFSDF